MIETKNLSKIYNPGKFEVKAVNDVNSLFKEGEFTSVVGPSGSGKTTFLNCVGGLDNPTSGDVYIAGENITRLSGSNIIQYRLKNIGFVFQSYNLIPVLSAKENIEMIMLLQGIDEKSRRLRTDELLNQVDLYEMKDRRPSELSGGQQQRVAVARALASKPKFILADEPTANLDTASTSNLLDIMSKLNENEKITFIFSTHDQRVIDRARRVVTLEDGKIVSDTKK
jgi:putative ABC transport system ATP-binding protein|tara:strand:- start:971 stop:1648 length:678 start_codon:yes stop_codon:yes gene_type:complete